MLLQMFDNDWRTKTYKEISSINENAPRQIRLKSLTEVKSVFRKLREPLIVCKPLVESHRTCELLEYFDGSQALWAYRDYRDVINSNVNAFHSQIESCRIIAEGVPDNWRSEVVPERALRLVQSYYHDSMSRHDAAALMWYARNCLYFEQGLQAVPAVRLWNYDEFVKNPVNIAHDIYTWLKMSPPKPSAMRFVNPKSIGLGKNVSLSNEIEVACHALLDNLNQHYNKSLTGSGRPLPQTEAIVS